MVGTCGVSERDIRRGVRGGLEVLCLFREGKDVEMILWVPWYRDWDGLLLTFLLQKCE